PRSCCQVSWVSSMTAPTKSTVFSSSAVVATFPEVPTESDGGPPPDPTRERKSTPVAQLRSSSTSRPPIPNPPALMPMPERPRRSSTLPLSPGVHLIGVPSLQTISARSGTPTGPAVRGKLGTEGSILYLDVSPFALLETQDGQEASGGVADQDRRPDAGCLQLAGAIQEQADARGKQHLGDQGNKERASRIAGALESAGVGQRHSDKQ